MIESYEDGVKEIERAKKIIYEAIGKTQDFTITDFENYVQLKFGVKIYDSLQELFLIENNEVRPKNCHYYVSRCDIDIRKNPYKVFKVCNRQSNVDEMHKYTLVYLTYKGDYIKNIFIETSGVIENERALLLFAKDSEQQFLKHLKVMCHKYSKNEWIDTLRMLGLEEDEIKKSVKEKYGDDE